MKKMLLSFGLGLVALSQTSFAQDAVANKYEFDKVHTQIMFSVEHAGFSFSQGKFLDFDGHFTFDQSKPDASAVDVTIKTASINMDDQKWDDHLKNPDFFNVEKFPEMTFKSTAAKVTGENTGEITGDLTILGVTKPVTLMVRHNKTDKHPFSGKLTSGFSATAKIKRSDFGMNYGLPMVGDDVAIHIEVEASVADEAATPAQ